MLYGFPIASWLSGRAANFTENFVIVRLMLWLTLPLVFLYSKKIEKLPMLLWKDHKYGVGFVLISLISLYVVAVTGAGLISFLIQKITHEDAGEKLLKMGKIFNKNILLIIFTSLTAGIVEELLMRGYIQPRLAKLYNSQSAGVYGSAILFAVLHSTYGTWSQVAGPFFIGVVFSAFYKKYSNIHILIICHFFIDFISLSLMNFVSLKTTATLFL